jgi:hypothetical protein
MLTEIFRGFRQSLEANVGVVPFPSTSFPIHHSVIILPTDVMQPHLLKMPLVKLKYKNIQLEMTL